MSSDMKQAVLSLNGKPEANQTWSVAVNGTTYSFNAGTAVGGFATAQLYTLAAVAKGLSDLVASVVADVLNLGTQLTS